MSTILNACEIYKSFSDSSGNIQILNGASLEVVRGESVAIVGASGSGKSTLLALLAGLDLPDKGKICLRGDDLTSLDEAQRAQCRASGVSFVFQSFYLLEELTALENVALPLELFHHNAPRKVAAEWLSRLGLEERCRHFPSQLSGGEQQRVALARAFATRPECLFADEPTANLDYATSKSVIEHLFSLHNESQSAMVLVTHDERLAKRCDRAFVLEGGQLHVLD